MNKNESSTIARAVMRDKTPVAVNVNMSDAWLLLGSIQEQIEKWPELAAPVKTQLLGIAFQLQFAITRSHPETRDLIAGGWDFVEDQDAIRAQIDKFLVSANADPFR